MAPHVSHNGFGSAGLEAKRGTQPMSLQSQEEPQVAPIPLLLRQQAITKAASHQQSTPQVWRQRATSSLCLSSH